MHHTMLQYILHSQDIEMNIIRQMGPWCAHSQGPTCCLRPVTIQQLVGPGCWHVLHILDVIVLHVGLGVPDPERDDSGDVD